MSPSSRSNAVFKASVPPLSSTTQSTSAASAAPPCSPWSAPRSPTASTQPSAMPSTASALPRSTPDRMQSSVRRPMTCCGGVSSVAGSLAVRLMRASDAVRTPGMMTPPINRPSAVMQSKVVAVPKSTTMVSRWNSLEAASVLRMRSAPTVRGSSTSRVMGRRARPSTTTGAFTVAVATASHTVCVTGGTTEATMAARTSLVERPLCDRAAVIAAAHSSGVRPMVVSRQWDSRVSSRKRPSLVSVLLMFTASATRERHGRSGELDMSLPRVGGPQSRVHEQGAVGADPRRAAGERRPELPASEPVALPEGDALRFSEAGGVGGEAEESRYQAVEHVEAPHGREEFRQRDRVVRDLRRDRVAHVHPDPQSQPLQDVALPAALAEDARHLAVHHDDVVGPLELGDGPARELVHDVGQDQPRPDGHDAQLPVSRMQQRPQPHASDGRVRGAPAPPAPGGLLFGADHGSRRCLLGGDLVNRVEGRGEAAEQAALGHAPAPREGGGGHPVQL